MMDDLGYWLSIGGSLVMYVICFGIMIGLLYRGWKRYRKAEPFWQSCLGAFGALVASFLFGFVAFISYVGYAMTR